MAKNDKNLDKALSNAIDDLLKDYKGAMKEAVKFAVIETKKDYMTKAKTCLEEYYDNFDPTRYDRTHTLQYAFLPYEEVTYGENKIIGSVGVEYSPEMLEQFIDNPIKSKTGKIKHLGYYGSEQYQPVDTWWVIDNYLKGIHPVTNGSRDAETAVYYEIYDPVSPNQKMEDYTREYEKTFDENVLISLMGQIAKKLK